MRRLIIVGLLAATGLAACGGPQRVQRRNQFHLSYSDFEPEPYYQAGGRMRGAVVGGPPTA